MNTISPQVPSERRRRRLHSDEFKAHAVAAAAQPSVSMAAVAMSLGINANLLRRWVRDAEVQPGVPARSDPPKTLRSGAGPTFVPVQLPAPAVPAAPPSDIRMEVRRGAVSIVVTWPATLATECGNWLRELLR